MREVHHQRLPLLTWIASPDARGFDSFCLRQIDDPTNFVSIAISASATLR